MTMWDVVRAELREMNASRKPESWNAFAIQTGVILVVVGVVLVALRAAGRGPLWEFFVPFLGVWIGVSALDTSWQVRQWRAAAGPRTAPGDG